MPQNNLEAQLRGVTEWDASQMQLLSSVTSLQHWKFAPHARFEPGVLTALSQSRFLQSLWFEDSELEHQNMRALSGCPALRRLYLQGCAFEKGDFAALCEQWTQGTCPKLTEIGLEGTGIGDEELVALSQIKRLRILRLTGTTVSDEGVKHLTDLRKLEILAVSHTRVSEDGLMHLAALPRLGSVGLYDDREKTCEWDERFFRAQIALQKSKKPLNVERAEAAGACLRSFMKTAQEWTRTFRERSTLPSDFQQRWNEINTTKNDIAHRFYSTKMMERDGPHPSIGDPRSFQYERDWMDMDTPSSTQCLFYAEEWYDGGVIWKRYTMVLENGQWKLDNTQRWYFGWQSDFF